MKGKFDKYWKEYSVILALGSVLDPTSKLEFLSFCFKKLYPNDYQDKVERVKDGLHSLFGEYANNVVASNSSLASSSTEGGSHSLSSQTFNSSIIEEWKQERRQKTSNDGKSEVDIYLEEACIVGNVDVLQYWKLNKLRFPQLATLACDILSIPITTVASESSFSIGGRILRKYRNFLLPKTVQALICTRNWLHDFKEVGPSDVQEVEEIPLFAKETSQGN